MVVSHKPKTESNRRPGRPALSSGRIQPCTAWSLGAVGGCWAVGLPASLTAPIARPIVLPVFGEPTAARWSGWADAERRLRGRRGSAADPLNLLQVMLAKGAAEFPSPISRTGTTENDKPLTYDRNQRILRDRSGGTDGSPVRRHDRRRRIRATQP